ncbi:hypothetical protein NEHOM01_1597 [Nematocida homosporus]|uniref:uncharacterized protein n=1 Tax=Nematocida homosporus TaxID=1912981 RepID=UPI00221FCF6F|nr:uncharacterized protein NEHOM01_1597 [Nematocida homosporus]KAI5186629.1 hypothetical protein NEHOM01_1597 [Nematocida homosporus]
MDKAIEETITEKEIGMILADPYAHAVSLHIENIEKPSNSIETKNEYIDGLEAMLIHSSVSTAPSILAKMKDLVKLIHVPGVEANMCVLLGHMTQNVIVISQELVKCHIFSECLALSRTRPTALPKIAFLLTILDNTLPNFKELLIKANEDPLKIRDFLSAETVIDSKTEARLTALCAKLE